MSLIKEKRWPEMIQLHRSLSFYSEYREHVCKDSGDPVISCPCFECDPCFDCVGCVVCSDAKLVYIDKNGEKTISHVTHSSNSIDNLKWDAEKAFRGVASDFTVNDISVDAWGDEQDYPTFRLRGMSVTFEGVQVDLA